MQVWTKSSYENIFQDAVKNKNDRSIFELVVVKNEFASFQILMRSKLEFKINNIKFSNLVSENNIIENNNFKYNFVEYEYLSNNTIHQNENTILRKAPGYFPEPLSNNPTIDVAANSTQPIWVTLYVPKTAVEGNYSGMIEIDTSEGIFNVGIRTEVNDVTIPDSKDATFQWMFHQQITGAWFKHSTLKSHVNDPITAVFGHERWTEKWWQIVKDMAVKMKECRTNALFVNNQQLLLDGGTTVDSLGKYTFNWSKFDEYIQFFIDAGVVKTLEGVHIGSIDYSTMNFNTFLLQKNDSGEMETGSVLCDSEASDNWLDQFLPALQTHVEQKGWLDIWYQHIGDEAMNQAQLDQYDYLYGKIREKAPAFKVGDPVTEMGFAKHQMDLGVDIVVPLEDTYDKNRNIFDAYAEAGKTVYVYNCCVPQYEWLNRFIDKPVWQMRTLGWLCHTWGVDGFLHWGWNFWITWEKSVYYKTDEDPFKGDHYTVYPDFENNCIKSSIRYVACRDAAQDFEIFKILEKSNPKLSKQIAESIARNAFDDYSTDIDFMIAKRAELVRAAAGKSNT